MIVTVGNCPPYGSIKSFFAFGGLSLHSIHHLRFRQTEHETVHVHNVLPARVAVLHRFGFIGLIVKQFTIMLSFAFGGLSLRSIHHLRFRRTEHETVHVYNVLPARVAVLHRFGSNALNMKQFMFIMYCLRGSLCSTASVSSD